MSGDNKASAASRSTPEEKVAILDAGAQYGKLIDRKVRELNVLSEMLPLNTPPEKLTEYKALIISGGPQSVYGEKAPPYDKRIFDLGKPILGICYGMQLVNHVFGGKVEAKNIREDGVFPISRPEGTEDSLLFDGLPSKFNVLLTHGDSVTSLGHSLRATALSASGIVAACENAERRVYAVQFHPEVDLSQYGNVIFRNFLFKIAGLKGTYTRSSRKQAAIEEIRRRAGDSNVLVLVSGGVDSSVCAALLLKALKPEQVYGLHIDSGFMRKNESDLVCDSLKALGFKHLKLIRAAEIFASARTVIDGQETEPLCQVLLPEIKRKIVGDTFMRVAEAAIKEWGLPRDIMLAQGTLRPDLIESASHLASCSADVIKTHHNDTALVRELRAKGRIIEPLKDYHKDEVRELGLELGLPEALVWRQPFPGPGLSIRILCVDQPYKTSHHDAIVAGISAFATETIHATLLPCRTVGVQGDARTYSCVCALSSDSAPDWPKLFDLAREIPKAVHGINRVVYVFGPALPTGKLESVTPTRLSPEAIEQLREADDIVNQILVRRKLTRKLSQVPVILLPVDFGVPGRRSICIRPFITNDFMTGVAAVPGSPELPMDALEEIVNALLSRADELRISRVCFDLTSKPPGTTEWE